MKRINKSIFLAALLLWGCNNSEQNITTAEIVSDQAVVDYGSSESKMASAPAEQAETNTTEVTNSLQKKKIIRSGSISVETQDIKKAKETIDALLHSFNGYYEEENTSAGSTYTNYTLKLRIPAQSFENFIKKLESGNDKITDKSIQSEDISIQYYDVESRLKSKRTYLEQYQNMVKSAKNVKDLLEIQEQIRQLQEDIESSESLLRNLSGQVSYSTLSVNLYHANPSSSAYSVSFFSKIKDALVTGWNLIEIIFLGIVTIWPIIIAVGLLIFGWKRYKRNKEKRN
ncbi:DUF4349 domain-containing protein [Sphingobacterium composti Ten et al. 2007 non Yoo et al. 2007]|uniref:DUF4349 domain-containing protein n=1 Tax=Sphingobacterium composti TaxID=363260 RepID=UPI0013594374|nr:DUF4349 domain-containing protein [Sphingobacterium composti Ten et al. 2007 non Yoo et al. 2007]